MVNFFCIFSASPGNPASHLKTQICFLNKMSGFCLKCADFYWTIKLRDKRVATALAVSALDNIFEQINHQNVLIKFIYIQLNNNIIRCN